MTVCIGRAAILGASHMAQPQSEPEATTSGYLDFEEIKQRADVAQVLAHLGYEDKYKVRGKEFVMWCPLGSKTHGKKDSLAINSENKKYQCFACRSKGTVIDFVKIEQGLHIRDAASLIQRLTDGEKPEVEKPNTESEDTNEIREALEDVKERLDIAVADFLEEVNQCKVMIEEIQQNVS